MRWKAADIRTRELFTIHGGLHLRSSTWSCTLSRSRRPRTCEFLKPPPRMKQQGSTSWPQMMIFLQEYLRQQKPKEKDEEPPWVENPLYSMYDRKSEEVAGIENMCQVWSGSPKVKVGDTSKCGREWYGKDPVDFQIHSDKLEALKWLTNSRGNQWS